MDLLCKSILINASSWMREGNYIKVPNPDSNRIVYLLNEQADLFELLDEGLDIHEILKILSEKYVNISAEIIEQMIQTLQKNDVVRISSQFDEK